MELEQAILGRRAVRDYLPTPVPDEAVAKILKAGAMAPSAMDRQPCHYIVMTDAEKIRELSAVLKAMLEEIGLGERIARGQKLNPDPIFYAAPLVILICAEKDKWAAINCSLSAQNMMLTAYDLGLGSCFIGYALPLSENRSALRTLGMPDSQDLFCPLAFGYPKAWPARKDREAKVLKRI